MPQHNPRREQGRESDTSNSSRLSSRGSFARCSSRSRSRSLSPRKLHPKQPLHIRMDLTEMQMDRITDAFTHKVNSSPASSRYKSNGSPSKSISHVDRPSAAWPADESPSRNVKASRSMRSPTFSELMPGKNLDPVAANLAERRHRDPPSSIEVNNNHAMAKTPQRSRMVPVPDVISPLSPVEMGSLQQGYRNESSSVYSQVGYQPQSSGRVEYQQNPTDYTNVSINDEVLDMYQCWTQTRSPDDFSEPAGGHHKTTTMTRHSHKSTRDLRRREQSPQPFDAHDHSAAPLGFDDNSVFSPLALYFRGPGFPSEKKGEKTMIGKNGWLERTGKSSPEKWKPPPQKKYGILDSIKKIAKDMSELHHQTKRGGQLSTRELSGSQVAISLNAREQSLLYCELEYHLTNALNNYIGSELERGRLIADNLKKVSDAWYQQGRPRVVGFRYDLETQLELISLHINEFSFHGRRQGNPVEISGLLHAMKVNARAMRIRTFCQPDSVIAKQLVDSQSLFNLISVSQTQQIALAEVAQFFKVILERERDLRSRKNHEKRQTEE